MKMWPTFITQTTKEILNEQLRGSLNSRLKEIRTVLCFRSDNNTHVVITRVLVRLHIDIHLMLTVDCVVCVRDSRSVRSHCVYGQVA